MNSLLQIAARDRASDQFVAHQPGFHADDEVVANAKGPAFGVGGVLMLALEGPGPLWRELSVPGLAAVGLAFVAGLRALKA